MAQGSLMQLGRTYRHFKRYREIVGVLVKYGFGDVVRALGVDRVLEAGVRALTPAWSEDLAKTKPERVRLTLEELGPTFIKAGQFLSTRADLLPPEYLAELSKLQDRVPPFPYEDARAIVEKELGRPLEAVFLSFERAPLAAASIAQIHRARLVTGESVVVKIQRPGITERMSVDLEILLHLAGLMEKHLEDFSWRRPTLVVKELRSTLDRELDFTIEASHRDRFAREFAADPTVYVPKIRREASSSRVLTMEYIEGVKADDLEAFPAAGLRGRDVARRLTANYLKQIFLHGFFHADPHPGNVFLLPGSVLCYLDYGMMGRLDRRTRETLADFFAGVAERDEPAVARDLMRLAITEGTNDRKEFERSVGELLDQYAYRPVKELEFARLVQQLFEATTRHRLRLPPDLFLLVKALGELESLDRTLDPEFDVVRETAPFIERLKARRLGPRRLLEDVLDAGEEALRLLGELPEDLREFMRRVRTGALTIEFEHKGLEEMTTSLERISNRLSFAILLAALIIGSSLIVHARTPPLWHSIPVIGLGGYLLSAFMALLLLVAILKHGRM